MPRILLFGALLCFLFTPLSGQDESGPNFETPEDWDDEERAVYQSAVEKYRIASEATEDSVTKFEAAIAALQDAMRQDKGFAPTRYYLGIAYQITREYNKARNHLEQAVKYNRDFHQAMVELGDTYMHLKKPNKAGRMYDKAIDAAPDYLHAFRMRAFYYLREFEFEDAIADADHVLGEEPEDGLAQYVKQIAERELFGEDWAEDETFVVESTHYIVMTNTDQEFAEYISFRAELIHEVYEGIFPKISTGRRKFPIVVYRDRDEYRRKGGPPTAGGHYEPLLRKLVLFRYEELQDTMLVLQHEGFHQFLHYYLEDAPQWFNEGVADYFGPTEYIEEGGREAMEIRPNPWRVQTIKQALRAGRVRSFRDLMMMSQAELYHPQWASIHYAQSWSIIYFLCEYNEREHFPILKAYFKALRDGDGQEEAFLQSFGEVDLETIERQWVDFVRKLRE